MNPLPKNATIGEKYRPAMKIKDQAEADAYFEILVQHNMSHGHSREEAEKIERSNLGYYSGYYDSATAKRVFKLFRCAHPVFGTTVPTVNEAAFGGRNLAEKED